MTRDTRPISWIRAAKKDFIKFPQSVRTQALTTLSILAEGQKPDNVKPLRSFKDGVQEIVIPDATGTYRVMYVLKVDTDIWVLHAFQKKSKTGIKTPKPEIDLTRYRLKRLKEALR